jgi:hypothetical protein
MRKFYPDLQGLTRLLVQKVEECVNILGKPVLIFAQGDDSVSLHDIFRQKYTLNDNYLIIDGDEKALHFLKANLRRSTGVFLLDHKYARGWDCKLTQEAVVLVFDPKGLLDLSTVIQMAGRGNRRKGAATCTYFSHEVN